jgi:hypothetical protein
MSITISIRPRPISANSATPLHGMFRSGLPARLEQMLRGMRQRRARRHMILAVEQLGHPGVLADCHRATRSWA